MGNDMYANPVIVTPRTELMIELQTEVMPFLRDNDYPAHKLEVLDSILVVMAEKAEKVRAGWGTKNGKKK
jgi:hypothetical protein